MKRSRLIKFMIIVLVIELAGVAGVAFFKSRSDTPPVQKKQKEAVIEGDIVQDSKAANTDDNMKQPEQDVEKASESEPKEKDLSETKKNTEDTEQKSNDTAKTRVKGIQAQLENLVSTEYAAGGSISICTGKVDENDMAMVGGGRMQAASLIKLYVAGCVYENYGTVSAHESYAGETGALLSSMITVSDNDACNTLVTRLGDGDAQAGMARVNQFCEAHGFSDTHMGRLMLQPNDVDDNYTSVRDCCTYLKMARAGQLQGAVDVLEYMNQQQRRGKIPAGIPAGVTVGNKTGELSNVENDAAIVYSDSGIYVLCVMSENLSDTYSAQQFIARVSSVVYECMQ